LFILEYNTFTYYILANAQRISKHAGELRECLDPNFGFTDKLLASGVLTNEEITKVKTYLSYYEQNDTIIHFLIRPSFILCEEKYKHFLSSLHQTSQRHVANYLTYDGGKFSPELFGNMKQRLATLSENCLIVENEMSTTPAKLKHFV